MRRRAWGFITRLVRTVGDVAEGVAEGAVNILGKPLTYITSLYISMEVIISDVISN